MAIVINHQRMITSRFEEELCDNWSWLITAGFFLMALSLIAIVDITTVQIAPTKLIGSTFIAASVIFIGHAVKFWSEKPLGFCLHLLAGMLYGSVGTIIFMNMHTGMFYLILILAAFYVAIGTFLIITAMMEGLTNLGWGWTFLSGIVNIMLALLLWTQLLNFDIWLLSLIVAVDIFFSGLALFMLGTHTHHARQCI